MNEKSPILPDVVARCGWAKGDLYIQYHDEEWGVPVHDDRRLFEFLILEGAQAGLSWITILKKREHYRRVFDQFEAAEIARYRTQKVRALLLDAGIVRNRLKIESAIRNAKAYLAVQNEFGTFDQYVWRFVGGQPIRNHWKSLKQIPARTRESDALSAICFNADLNLWVQPSAMLSCKPWAWSTIIRRSVSDTDCRRRRDCSEARGYSTNSNSPNRSG